MPDNPFNLLLIDDTAINRRLLSEALRHYFPQCTVILCANAEEGLAQASTTLVDVILLDIQLPDMNGIDVCHLLKKNPETRPIPVLLLTAQMTDEKLRLAGMEAGADDFICRPISNAELAAHVRIALRIKRAEDALREQNQLLEQQVHEQTQRIRHYETAIESSPDLIAVLDHNHRYVLVNETFCQYFDTQRDTLIGQSPTSIFGERYFNEFIRDKLSACLKGETVTAADTRHFPNLGTRHMMVQYFPFREENDEITGAVALLRDVTDETLTRAELEVNTSQLHQLHYYDPLTELPNMHFLQDRLDHALARARRFHHQVALLHIDLDRFDKINASFGRAEGDQVLRLQAKRLQSVCRESDTLVRLSGDEFLLVMEQINQVSDVMLAASNLRTALESPVSIDGHDVFLTATMGISLFPSHGSKPSELLKRAHEALKLAKKEEQGTYRFAGEDEGSIALQSLLLESHLRQSLERSQFELFYQPQYNLKENRVTGMEALIRWQHPEQGLILPGAFIPAAENSGLIVPIGDWVLERACQQAAQWQSAYPGLRVAVNISALQFRQRDLPHKVARALKSSGLAPELLELELTESAVMENVSQAIETMHKINRMGVQMAIDDFGTGYSSLGYLRQFPIQKLKIDRSFVSEVTHRNSEAAIADSVISLAQNLRLEVIAEGIENEEQLVFLTERGCQEGQGFLFSRPQPLESNFQLFEELGHHVKKTSTG